MSFLGAVTLEWRSVKGKQGPSGKKGGDVEEGKTGVESMEEGRRDGEKVEEEDQR